MSKPVRKQRRVERLALEDRVQKLENQMDRMQKRTKDLEESMNLLLWKEAVNIPETEPVVAAASEAANEEEEVRTMAIQPARVGAFGGYVDGVWDDEAILCTYDYDEATDRVVTIYYKNALGSRCDFVLRNPTTQEVLFNQPLPPLTRSIITRNLGVGLRPSIVGVSVALEGGRASAAQK